MRLLSVTGFSSGKKGLHLLIAVLFVLRDNKGSKLRFNRDILRQKVYTYNKTKWHASILNLC